MALIQILQGEEISNTGEKDGDGGVLPVELEPPKSITGESQQSKLQLIVDVQEQVMHEKRHKNIRRKAP